MPAFSRNARGCAALSPPAFYPSIPSCHALPSPSGPARAVPSPPLKPHTSRRTPPPAAKKRLCNRNKTRMHPAFFAEKSPGIMKRREIPHILDIEGKNGVA